MAFWRRTGSEWKGVSEAGHDYAWQAPMRNVYHDYHARLIVRLAQSLSSIKEGDRSVFDNTTNVFMSENGDAHRSGKLRWPMLIVGNAGGKLRADGRFVRLAARGQPGWRPTADMFSTLATAVGAPTETFGMGGFEPTMGSIAELMA